MLYYVELNVLLPTFIPYKGALRKDNIQNLALYKKPTLTGAEEPFQ